MSLSVIGAGFGRTGTLSLKMALELLGFGPCCHGSDFRHYAQGAGFWQHIFDYQPINLDEFFRGYVSTVDSPSSRFYLQLAERYPLAKVILTWRETDAWLSSYQATILQMKSSPHGAKYMAFLFGSEDPDRESMIAAYERHNAEVQRMIPEDRLLVYDVRSGWPPLCEFLKIPCPEAAFPRTNSSLEFKSTLDGMMKTC